MKHRINHNVRILFSFFCQNNSLLSHYRHKNKASIFFNYNGIQVAFIKAIHPNKTFYRENAELIHSFQKQDEVNSSIP